MSGVPPNGPPYYYPSASTPAPGGYAYSYVPVAAPYLVPMYPAPPPHYPPPPYHPYPPAVPETQPTYVTNHIYQQPAQSEPAVKVVEEPPPEVLDWVPTSASTAFRLSHRAFVGGKEGWDQSPLWVIRAHHSGEFVPGKLAAKHNAAFIPYAGKEVPVHNFELLCAPANYLRWVVASNGQVPAGAIAAGNTHNAEPLYIARCRYKGSITPGKVHPSHGTAYISSEGIEIPYKNYEVLCRIV